MNEHLFAYLAKPKGGEEEYKEGIEKAFLEDNVRDMEALFRSLFAGIPYEWHKKADRSRYEGYYASVVYSFLAGAGLEIIAEDYTSRGRIDLTVFHGDKIYLFEFKVVEQEGEIPRALEALKSRGYVEKYRGRYGEIYLMGMDFSAK